MGLSIRQASVKRQIVDRTYFRTPSHPRRTKDTVSVLMECGHERVYKGSQEPGRFAFCTECPREKNNGEGRS